MNDGSEWICAVCGRTFLDGWTDAEAMAERALNFSNDPPGDDCNLCDDCYQKIMKEIAASN
jgi:hypothetical protein